MKAFARWARTFGILALALSIAGLAAGQPAKPAEIPSASEVAAAVDTLRDVYEKDYAAAEKDSKSKKALAQKLFDLASKRKTAAMTFACYEESRRLAATGGDVKLAVASIAASNKRFANVRPTLLSETLKLMAGGDVPSTEASLLVALAREEASAALDREEYDSATELMGIAAAAAKKAEDLDLAFDLREQFARYSSLQKAVATVRTKPDDAAANALLGSFWTFERGRWELGLKYLAKGTDKALAEVAEMDAAMPKTARERTNLADRWYGLYKADRKVAFVERAWEWYSAALAVATGDEELKPNERAKEIEKAHPSLFDRVVGSNPEAVAAVAIAPDGKTLVSVGNDNVVRVWDVATNKLSRTLEGHTSWVGSAVVSPDGTRAYTAGGDRVIRVWDLKTGRQTDLLEGHQLAIRGLAISADGNYLASGSNDSSCRLWDLTSKKEIGKFGSGKESIECVAIAPDGSRVLAGNEAGTVAVYDTKTGAIVSKFDKHGSSIVYGIAVSKDGKTAISGSRDKEIQVWEIATGKPIKTLSGHTEQVYQVALSPDDKQLLSVSYDKSIRLWDLASGKELKRFEGHTDGVQGACYSPDGRSIYSASWDKTIRKWRIPSIYSNSIASDAAKKVD